MLRRAAVEYSGDVGMIHHRQRLALGLEAGHHLFGVHAELDDFKRHPAAHRFLLLGHTHHAKTALADFFQQLVTADSVAGLLGQSRNGQRLLGRASGNRALEETSCQIMCRQQGFHLLPQGVVAPAGRFKYCSRSAGDCSSTARENISLMRSFITFQPFGISSARLHAFADSSSIHAPSSAVSPHAKNTILDRRISGLLHLPEQPRPRKRPRPLDVGDGNIQFPRRLLLRQADEETKFHNFRRPGINFCQDGSSASSIARRSSSGIGEGMSTCRWHSRGPSARRVSCASFAGRFP